MVPKVSCKWDKAGNSKETIESNYVPVFNSLQITEIVFHKSYQREDYSDKSWTEVSRYLWEFISCSMREDKKEEAD